MVATGGAAFGTVAAGFAGAGVSCATTGCGAAVGVRLSHQAPPATSTAASVTHMNMPLEDCFGGGAVTGRCGGRYGWPAGRGGRACVGSAAGAWEASASTFTTGWVRMPSRSRRSSVICWNRRSRSSRMALAMISS